MPWGKTLVFFLFLLLQNLLVMTDDDGWSLSSVMLLMEQDTL